MIPYNSIHPAKFLMDEPDHNSEQENDEVDDAAAASDNSPRYDSIQVYCDNMLNLCSSVRSLGSGMKRMMENVNMMSSASLSTLGE